MRIQFAAPIKNRHGEDVMEQDVRHDPPRLKKLSLGDICCAVLDATLTDDKDPKDKVRRWDLIQAITKADHSLTPLEVLESDISMIKDRLFKSNLSASICGCAVKLLSPALEMDEEHEERKPRKVTG